MTSSNFACLSALILSEISILFWSLSLSLSWGCRCLALCAFSCVLLFSHLFGPSMSKTDLFDHWDSLELVIRPSVFSVSLYIFITSTTCNEDIPMKTFGSGWVMCLCLSLCLFFSITTHWSLCTIFYSTVAMVGLEVSPGPGWYIKGGGVLHLYRVQDFQAYLKFVTLVSISNHDNKVRLWILEM